MKFLNHTLRIWRGFKAWEVSLFKIYLLSISLLLAIWIPGLLNVSIWIYVIIWLATLIPVTVKLRKEHWNYISKILSDQKIQLFNNWTMLDFSLFKTGMLASWLILAILFPGLLTGNIGLYLAVAWFGAWYFVSKMVK